MAKQGLVDRDRMVIRGGSAGAFTTLACLCFQNVFKAGASYYGFGDLGRMAQETHKFEQNARAFPFLGRRPGGGQAGGGLLAAFRGFSFVPWAST